MFICDFSQPLSRLGFRFELERSDLAHFLLPPPPPNQIIHVRFEEGVSLDDSYEPHMVMGELTSEVTRNNLADSAYSIVAEGVDIYTY